MNCFGPKLSWILVAGMAPMLSGYLFAQSTPSPTVTVSDNSNAAPPKQLLPPAKSPIDFFREVLSRQGTDRLEFLKNRSPASQKLIMAKVREYEQLNPEDRELRLRVTELHYYLLPLMSLSATNRATLLTMVAPETRKLVEDRLAQWDKLSPESQRDLLQNEATLRKLTEIASTPPAQQQQLVTSLTEAQRAELEAGIRKWQALSGEQRQRTIRRFKSFFELTDEEKQEALSTLSEAERHQLERTLAAFGNLTPPQRAQCVRSFEKFASLSPQERVQFLKSAEVWNQMSPSQRQLWRDLVYNLGHQPPLPSALNQPPQPRPPSPPAPTPSTAHVTATN